jgi:hypothetical protein
MRHGLLTKYLLLCCAVAAFSPASVRADFTSLYSNLTNFTGQGAPQGGATNLGGDTITAMLADDITAGPGLSGHTVDQMTFSVANFNSTAVTARAIVQIYAADGTGGGPGTLITAIAFNPIAFTAGQVGLFSFTSTTLPIFTMPTGTFWAGISFDDNFGTTGATADQLNLLGQGSFDPPTVGSSQPDVAFLSSSAASVATNNPDGTIGNFGGNPIANFGWDFSTAQAVPEPSTLALSAVGGLVLVGVRLTRRRRSAGDSAIAA